MSLLPIQQPPPIGFTPAVLRNFQLTTMHPLHDGNELHMLSTQPIAEIPVHFQRVPLIDGMHRAQDIPLHIMSFQCTPSGHHGIMAAATRIIDTVHVMQFGRPIHADADQHVVSGKQLRPPIVDQCAVGLQDMVYTLPRARQSLGTGERMGEEPVSPHHRLTALPSHGHITIRLGFQVTAQMKLHHSFAHALVIAQDLIL